MVNYLFAPNLLPLPALQPSSILHQSDSRWRSCNRPCAASACGISPRTPPEIEGFLAFKNFIIVNYRKNPNIKRNKILIKMECVKWIKTLVSSSASLNSAVGTFPANAILSWFTRSLGRTSMSRTLFFFNISASWAELIRSIPSFATANATKRECLHFPSFEFTWIITLIQQFIKFRIILIGYLCCRNTSFFHCQYSTVLGTWAWRGNSLFIFIILELCLAL